MVWPLLFILFTLGGIYLRLTIPLGKYDYCFIAGIGKLYSDSRQQSACSKILAEALVNFSIEIGNCILAPFIFVLHVAVFETTDHMNGLVYFSNPVDEHGPSVPTIEQNISSYDATVDGPLYHH